MRKFATLALILLLALPAGATATAGEVSSTDLIDNALTLDGKTVIYTGEVIGDIMKRGDYAWLNISDGNNAIGVWVGTALLGDIATPGLYGEHGDEVRVTGTYNRACREHGGDLDIHAAQIELVNRGYATPHAVQTWRLLLAVLLTAAAIALLLVKRRRV